MARRSGAWLAYPRATDRVLTSDIRTIARHLVSAERLPFTATYFGSIALTLYFALGPPSYRGDRPVGVQDPSSSCGAVTSSPMMDPLIGQCRRCRLPNANLHSTILTLFSSIVQSVALVWYLVSYFPMGSTGLRFAANFGGNRIAAWMNG
ncbi:protein transport protein sft2 [Recurvomyces mirabilis]|nr:protein transport protein sft2 [Recurvomyces mirabilis]